MEKVFEEDRRIGTGISGLKYKSLIYTCTMHGEDKILDKIYNLYLKKLKEFPELWIISKAIDKDRIEILKVIDVFILFVFFTDYF